MVKSILHFHCFPRPTKRKPKQQDHNQLKLLLKQSIELASICGNCHRATYTVTEKKLKKCIGCYDKGE